mmetsp:Transcript_23616/g.51540  ORF Transcript_23616/g.51540 Transcript_23616/m.51540 type:complete len:176 (-) Transcript_23616:158-685(-)|eukprot:CAMPEP_0118934132 /NCGR_PEP_ID=MMETSP1169-20130426/13658_1 /TAXON_ID=36882 /ORGANISM="Pyramimonas obovata, Strain CCMP722" /LENGTH=175 /DNA_ID=CAMNT_0006877003 /DNA_START=222 /DNA_END=749 /DNA_ORIENTATION=-
MTARLDDSACRKKEFKVDAEFEHWDFLKGSGPSAPPRVMTDPVKDHSFKPNWKQIRPMHVIDPHRPAYDTTERREKRFLEHNPLRKENLNARDKMNGFNPITGAQYDGLASKCVPPRGLKSLPERPEIPTKVGAEKTEGIIARAKLREQRIVTEGLRPGYKQASVADNFDPRFNG